MKTTPAMRGSLVSAAPTVAPSPGSSWIASLRDAGLVHQLDRAAGDQRRLRRGLCEHGVAGDERRRDLAGENGERKVPRRDAGDDAARPRPRPSPRPRSSGGSRPPRALRTRHRRGSCRPRARGARRARGGWLRRGRRPCAGASARSATGRADQAGNAASAAAIAVSTSAVRGRGDGADDLGGRGVGRPGPARAATSSRRSAAPPPIACRGRLALACSIAATATGSVMSSPDEFSRDGPKSASGWRIAGLAIRSPRASTRAIGSSATFSAGMPSSAIW